MTLRPRWRWCRNRSSRRAVDVALAIHMLYHVPSRKAAVRELRRVVAAGGMCIAVTNGSRHTRSLRALLLTSLCGGITIRPKVRKLNLLTTLPEFRRGAPCICHHAHRVHRARSR